MRLSTGLVTGFLLSQLLLSVPGSIFAQTNQSGSNQKKTVKISGKVSDENGKPIPGVSVQLKNGTVIAISSDAGIFSGTADADAILEFSSTGFGKKQIPVNNQESFSVVLFSDAKALDDIVVVGYGTQRKSDLTGAVTQLKVKDLNSVVTANIADAIQGRAAGVSISTNNAPGSQPTIRIRGLGSINASNNPLLVVDGIPLENATLSDFNSNDFASIEILKDASSTAIYGSRGANGVILLTTKTGTAGRNNVSVSTYYGSQSPGRLTEMPGREDFINFINDAYTNTTGKPVYSSANPAPAYNTNWQEALYRDHAPVQSYNVNFNGGTDKTKYLLSAGYFSQDGLLKESGFERFAVRTNLEQNVAKFLTVGTHLQVNRSIKNYNDPNIIDVFRYGWPTMPVKNEDGSFYYAIDDPFHRPYVEGRWNPVSNLGEIVDETGTNRIIGDVYALFKLGKNLTFKTNFAADLSDAKQYYYASSKSTNGWNSKGVGKQFYAQEQQILTDNILTYDNTWGKHKLVATAVYSYQKHVFESLSVNGTGFPSDVAGYNDVSLATNISKPTSDKYGNKLISGTARASYVYDNRYLLTLTGRYDGSTRFGVNNKWGFFPSVGAGWNVTNESFMEPLSEVISRLKIRGSYGYTGNQEIGNYRSLSLLSPTNYVYGSNNLLLGLNEGIGNPDLKWEST
jgi:TonB-linked SusC/RagA family outer membrane protein